MLKVRMKDGFNHWVPDEDNPGHSRRATSGDVLQVTEDWYGKNRSRCDVIASVEPIGGNDREEDVIPQPDEPERDIAELIADNNRENDVDLTAMQWKQVGVIVEGTFDRATLLRYKAQEEANEPKPRPAVLSMIEKQLEGLHEESIEEE